MLPIQDIEKKVLAFLARKKYSGVFSVATLEKELLKALAPENKSEEGRIRRELDSAISPESGYFSRDGKAVRRRTFFKDALFRIDPTPYELANAILFSGARFAPFCDENIFPDEYVITSDSKKIGVMNFEVPFKVLAEPFFMLGKAGLTDYLSAESNENFKRLRTAKNLENEPMCVSVYDMTEFFNKNPFKPGDSITAKVIDYERCEFEFTYLPASENPSPEAVKGWINDFEQALLEVCETQSDYPEIPYQIAEAYFIAAETEHDLRGKPFVSLEKYRTQMREIAIRRDGPDWLLVSADDTETPGQFEQMLEKGRRHEETHAHSCECGHDHGHDHGHGADGEADGAANGIKAEDFSISEGSTNSLDDILSELGSPLNSVEIYAMMLSDIANGDENFEDFSSRIRSAIRAEFKDDAQETAFINFTEENFEAALEYYNPRSDSLKEPLRARLLDLTESRVETTFALLARYADTGVPKDITDSLKKLHADILDTLTILNGDADFDEDPNALEQLELRVGDLEEAWERFSAETSFDA